MKEDAIKYRHALVVDTDKVIDIKDVNNENRHQYHLCCPYCKGEMIPVLPRERADHFRHLVEPDSDRCSADNVLHSLAERVFYQEYNKCLKEGIPFILSANLPIQCNKACVLMEHQNCKQHYIHREIDLTKYYVNEPKREPTLKGIGLNKSWRPDILLQAESGEQLWVEIYVHHSSTEEKKREGVVLEIRIQCEDDLDQFYNHKIEEFQDDSRYVSLSNKELFARKVLEGVEPRLGKMPCEYYYCYDYDPIIKNGNGGITQSINHTDDGHYRVAIRLNWYSSYNEPGPLLSKHY